MYGDGKPFDLLDFLCLCLCWCWIVAEESRKYVVWSVVPPERRAP